MLMHYAVPIAISVGWLTVTPLTAQAQTKADDARVMLAITAGVTIGQTTSGTLGGEATVRLTRALDLVVDGAYLWNITSSDVDSRAQTIATAARAAATPAVSASVFDAGLRVRVPHVRLVEPYALAGLGAARVRTDTAFARNSLATTPDALGIQLGRDLSSTITKPTLLLGGGLRVPIRERVSADVGVRYNLIFSRSSDIPADTNLNAVRLQGGIGFRF